MVHSAALKLFQHLDTHLSKEVLHILDKKDVIYMFEFSKDTKSGVLYVYDNEELSFGMDVINTQTDWFNDDKLWFRKSASKVNGKYEAFVSYLSDYRDNVVVNLSSPILRLKINSLQTPACAKLYHRQPIPAQTELMAA